MRRKKAVAIAARHSITCRRRSLRASECARDRWRVFGRSAARADADSYNYSLRFARLGSFRPRPTLETATKNPEPIIWLGIFVFEMIYARLELVPQAELHDTRRPQGAVVLAEREWAAER